MTLHRRDGADPIVGPGAMRSAAQSAPSAKLALRSADEITPKVTPWLWRNRIPLGMLSFLSGQQGLGKSTILADLAARVSRGDGALEGTDVRPRGVLFIALEDSAECTTRPRLEAAGADLARVYIASANEGEWWTVAEDAAELERTITALDLGLVVIDPITSHLGAGTDSHKDASVRRELSKLAAVAERTGAAIVYVMHLRKSSGDALSRTSGSIAFTALPRCGLVLGPSTDDPNVLVLALAKKNVSPGAPSLALRIVEHGTSSRVEWLGEARESADEVCATAEERKPLRVSQAQRAELFLRALLAHGPVPSGEIFERAKESRIGEKAVHAAGIKLDVEKLPMGKGQPWAWSLRATEQPQESAASPTSDLTTNTADTADSTETPSVGSVGRLRSVRKTKADRQVSAGAA